MNKKLRKTTDKFLKRLPIFLVAAISGAIIAMMLVFFLLPIQYIAHANVFIVEQKEVRNTRATYSEYCRSELIIDEVRRQVQSELSRNEMQRAVSVRQDKNSGVFLIGMKMKDPFLAERSANILAEVFCEKQNAPDTLGLQSAVIINKAYIPKAPQLPSYFATFFAGAAAGFALCFVVVVIIDFYDDSITSSEQLSTLYGKPVLGSIPHSDIKNKKQ